jgi:hypothetical protein
LLLDGTVICHETGANAWHRLVPDANGSYQNGQWDPAGFGVQAMPNFADARIGTFNSGSMTDTPCTACTYAPRFYASAVLPSGAVVVIGGEDIGPTSSFLSINGTLGGNTQVETNAGFIYSPGNPNFAVAGPNTWGSQLTGELYGSGNVGDAPGVVLANGTFALANLNGFDLETLDPTTGTFTAMNSLNKADALGEEGLNILPDSTVLVVDASQKSVFELLTLSPSPTWTQPNLVSGTNMPVNIPDVGTGSDASKEVGPAVLRPDGKLVYFSGNLSGQNALYDYAAGTWSHTTTMDFPNVSGTGQFSVADGPACLLPDGNVLVDSSVVTTSAIFNSPSQIYEFDYATNKLTATATQPTNVSSNPSWRGRMLLLPTGEVLFTMQDNAGGAQVYTAGGSPQDAWRPAITSTVPAHIAPGVTYSIGGTLFNGFSEGAKYGDDQQMATNYPLVRIKNTASGHVFYARTHDHSRMGLEPVGSTEVVTTKFDTPTAGNVENGPSTLVVVVNGIASTPASINVFPNLPPVAKCKDFSEPYTSSAGGVCVGSVTTSDIDNGSSDPDGDPIVCTLTPAGPFGLGSSSVTLTCTDPSGASDSCMATVTVVDNTPPTFNPMPATLAQTLCNAATQAATITIPTATSPCFPTVQVTGSIISANGVTLSPPIPVGSGSVSLAPGVYVIQWTATDAVGNTTIATQTLTLRGGIEASQSINFATHSQAILPQSAGFAMLGNTGTGDVELGSFTQTGGILSQGRVVLGSHSTVNGNVESAGAVVTHGPHTVTGTIAASTTVVLPPGLDLSGVTFPSVNNGPLHVAQHGTLTPAPGAYSDVRVDTFGTLVLTAGTYFFETFELAGDSRLNLDQSSGAVTLYVHQAMDYEGQIASIAGAPGGFVLGYAGTQPLEIGTPFLAGTLIAPNAEVAVTKHVAPGFTGELFAKQIDVEEHTTLVCDPVGLSAQQAGLSPTQWEVDTQWTASPGDGVQPRASGGCNVTTTGAELGGESGGVVGLLLALVAGLRRRRAA